MRFETHSHSMYSNLRLIDSINKPEDLIMKAAELGYAGITLTDHEALCGHIDFLLAEKELKKSGKIREDFKCGLGNEIYLVEERVSKQKYPHFILIAKNTEGHRALRELSSIAWLNSYKDRNMERVPVLKRELEMIVNKYPNTLIASCACIGGYLGIKVLDLVKAEKEKNEEEIYKIKVDIDSYIKWCKNVFGEDYYIEMAPGTSKDQKSFNKRIKPIANFYGIKMIVATDAHFLTSENREIHKAFLNSKDGEREVDSFYFDAHLMSDEEAFENLKEFYSKEEFDQMCENSLEIMNKIEGYDLFHNPIIPEVNVKVYPKNTFDGIEKWETIKLLLNSDNPQERYWINQCLEGLKEKNLWKDEYLDRVNVEAEVIKHISNKMENCLFSYFNTFQHYIDLFWDCGTIVGVGRGSAGSFLTNYLLGITQLDPIEWNLPYFRFLNKERAELPDIDIDLAPSKRPLILKRIREERGELNVAQVATFGTASSKVAIATACRGYRTKENPKGIDVDISQYMSSLVPIERGVTRTLSQCIYGDEEKGFKPIQELINQFNQYPGLLEIALGVEDLVVRRGIHASGVILYNNSPFETTALMKSPNGDITTQFELHRSEMLGDTKFDFLITEICEKLSVCLDLLKEDGYFSSDLNKREIYNKYLHPAVINLKDQRIWDALAAGTVQDVFQFNTQIGVETAKAIKPQNPVEMTAANALLRLTAPEGQDRPFDRYIKFRSNINLWYKEMSDFGLTKEEQKILEPYYLRDFGVPASQEQLMLMVMDPNISNFTLSESNDTRKVLAKKQIKRIPEIKEKFISQCPSEKLGEYAWETMMRPQMTYSFSEIHSLLYSFIGIQTLVLATEYPEIYWNCACLIVNSQSIEEPSEDEDEAPDEEPYVNEMREIEEDEEEEVEDSYDEDEDCDGYPVEVLVLKDGTKRKKVKAINYGKISSAMSKMKSAGVNIVAPNINTSSFTFTPDAKNNRILHGLSGITRINEALVKEIIKNRPYTSFEDFMGKVKVNKLQAINLIKSGIFDDFGERVDIMRQYIGSVCGAKKKLNLQNANMLIQMGLIPKELEFEQKIFNFNKYLRKLKLDGTYFGLDKIAMGFYEKNLDLDLLVSCEETESGFKIDQKKWKKVYDSYMSKIKSYIVKNHDELLEKLNWNLMNELWNKYALGTISKWEMDSLSCYIHEHELEKVKGFDNFFECGETPEIEQLLFIKGKKVPLYKLKRLCGTVLDKDKNKKTVTLLTKDGVVIVKIYGVFAQYDKQLSERGADGKKHVIQKSLFSRGNKIIVTGVRFGDSFVAKTYAKTPYHKVELILDVDENGVLTIQHERPEVAA